MLQGIISVYVIRPLKSSTCSLSTFLLKSVVFLDSRDSGNSRKHLQKAAKLGKVDGGFFAKARVT